MIAILDYGAGNLHSVLYGCAKVGAAAKLISEPLKIASGDRLIIPGTGRASSIMRALNKLGMTKMLKQAFRAGTPILGICVGAQIILDESAEDNTTCLSLLPGTCRQFEFPDNSLKVPHIGWNQVVVSQPHPVLVPLSAGKDDVYFVHSFYPQPMREQDQYAHTEYGIRFCSVVGRDNLVATQFHLEKSGRIGLEMLAAFANWDGTLT